MQQQLAVNHRYSFTVNRKKLDILTKVTIPQLVKKVPEFSWNMTVYSVSARIHHLPLSYARSIQNTSCHVISLPSILMSFSYIILGSTNGPFRSYFAIHFMYAYVVPFLPHACHMFHPSFSPWYIHHNNNNGVWYKSQGCSLCHFLQPLFTFSLWGTNVLLSTHFSDTVNLCSAFKLTKPVLYQYKTTVKNTIQFMRFWWKISINVVVYWTLSVV
jgi:hypothetical protein